MLCFVSILMCWYVFGGVRCYTFGYLWLQLKLCSSMLGDSIVIMNDIEVMLVLVVCFGIVFKVVYDIC